MFGNIGSSELLVVAVVLLLLFGGKQLPGFARGMGEALKELKNAKKEFNDALDKKD